MFTEQQLNVIQYCAEEVNRQGDGPLHVSFMLNAWNYVAEIPTTWPFDMDFNPTGQGVNEPGKLTLEYIAEIGKRVEPNENRDGFRTIPIGVSDGFNWIEKAPPDRIIPQLEALLFSYYHDLLFDDKDHGWGTDGRNQHKLSKSAEDQFYFAFEEIHPFRDGNGRVGKILYNYLKGTLDNPVMPPNFWGSSNP